MLTATNRIEAVVAGEGKGCEPKLIPPGFSSLLCASFKEDSMDSLSFFDSSQPSSGVEVFSDEIGLIVFIILIYFSRFALFAEKRSSLSDRT